MRGRMTRALLEGALAGLAGAVAMTAVGVAVAQRAARRPRVRLGHLVELADERPGGRAALQAVGSPAAVAVRLALGVACGVGYGIAVEYVPQARPGTGAVLAAAVWVAVDEWVAPLLGRSARGGRPSAAARVSAVAPQLAYGVTTDVCLALLRRRR